MDSTELIFWLAAALLGYTYAGYPLCLLLRLSLGRVVHGSHGHACEPSVSVLVIVHDEAARIEAKIANLLTLDYPREKLQLVIASDGSTDDTVTLARRCGEQRVEVREFRSRGGKPSVLNAVVPGLRGDIVVLMDVRQRVETGALRELVSNFASPAVGAVGGELVIGGGEGGGVGFYWRYEKLLRRLESHIDSTVGVSGAFYAIRRRLFVPLPPATLLDDVLLPMEIVRQGYRVLLDTNARAHDHLVSTPQVEYRRKVRTIAGNFQLFVHHRWLLNPWANRLWWQTVSHKVFRLLCPLALVVVLASNLMLLDLWLYRVSLGLQLVTYLAAAVAQKSPQLAKRTRLLSVPHAFCLLNWCTVVGCYRFLRGSQQVTWAKSPAI